MSLWLFQCFLHFELVSPRKVCLLCWNILYFNKELYVFKVVLGDSSWVKNFYMTFEGSWGPALYFCDVKKSSQKRNFLLFLNLSIIFGVNFSLWHLCKYLFFAKFNNDDLVGFIKLGVARWDDNLCLNKIMQTCDYESWCVLKEKLMEVVV